MTTKKPIKRPENDETQPVFDSIAQCSARTGIPVKVLRQWKSDGCDGFKGSRIYFFDLTRWMFAKGDPMEMDVDWGDELKKAQAKRQRIMLAKDEASIIDITEACEIVSQSRSRLVAAIERVFCNELPPLLKGMGELAIRAECMKKIDQLKAELGQAESKLTTK